MLYIRRLRNALSIHQPEHEWLERTLSDFVALDGNRHAMLASLRSNAGLLATEFKAWLHGPETGAALSQSLLDACAHLDDGSLGHREMKLRSYVDVSIQVRLLRIFIEYLPKVGARPRTVTPQDLTALLLEHHPSARVALLVDAELKLEGGHAEAALEPIRRALRVQAVCTTAQQMLLRAYRALREQGSTAPELAAADYDLTDKFCHLPFTHLSTGFQGSTFACACPAWLPFSIGNMLQADSADAVWNSEVAAEIRRSVLDGDFSYCSRTQCSYINTQKLPRKSEITKPKLRAYIDQHMTRIEDAPEMVELNHDPTCNLACPSCRTEIVAARSDDIDLYARATRRVILPLLKRVEGQTYITGGGEAFVSQHFRSILRALNRKEYPGLEVYLITNGQVLTPSRWREYPDLPEMLAIVSVSVDAARAETYEKLRRPGKWEPLMKNLDFLSGLRRGGQIRGFGLNFVVQKDNFREMRDFVALADSLHADVIWFQRVVNYGAYDEATFADVEVTARTHPDHPELLQILRDPIFDRPSINRHMLLSLLPEFVASDERFEFLY